MWDLFLDVYFDYGIKTNPNKIPFIQGRCTLIVNKGQVILLHVTKGEGRHLHSSGGCVWETIGESQSIRSHPFLP